MPTRTQAKPSRPSRRGSRPTLAERCFDQADVILLSLDRDGRVELINQRGCRSLGLSSKELTGQDWFDVGVPSEIRDEMRVAFRRLLAGEPALPERYPVRSGDGGFQLIRWRHVVRRGDDGCVQGLISSGSTVIDPPEVEQTLRDTAARLQAVVNTAVDAIITIDERGLIGSFNPAAERIFGYSADEVVGKNVKVLMPPPYHDEHDRYVSHYVQTGERKIIGIGREVVGRRKDGRVFPMDLSVGESRLGHRQIFTGIVRDISDRKRSEQQILALQREVVTRSARERQRIGRDLHDGLGQELTNISLRAGVLEKTLARKKQADPATARELVELTQNSIDHLRTLVKGLCPIVHESGGLESALRELAANIDRLPGVSVELEYQASCPISDYNVATQLFYIASEAVNNAIKHARAKAVSIRLNQENSGYELVIADDGRGFQEPRGADVGRGLRLMAYRAQIIDGTFHVRSEPGKGTVVTCNFPLSRTEEPS